MTSFRPTSCERARYLAALAPDAGLSEFEERMLQRHLGACAACSSFATSVAALTLELRMTPLVAQETAVATEFGGGRSRRSLRVPLGALTAAAAAVLMTSVVFEQKPARNASPSALPGIVADAPGENELEAIRQLRDVSLARPVDQDPPAGQPGMYLG